jgi:sigma-B regulation protein RsbU (phosphoserine phosphatase)
MVIDDDNINHMVIKRVLSKAGKFEIRKFLAADTALASLDALHSSSGYADFPHVILMDVNMPGISGIEAAQVIKKSYPGAVLPVIVITGHSSSHMRETALDAGCVDVVVKPIQASELVSKVMAAVETCIDTR